jgi:selenocysteine lyase/cysteine desulfurase
VSLSHVDPVTGAVLPVAAVAALAHRRGVSVLVDGSQAAGAIPVRLAELGADLYVVPASTWLLGPEGLGALATAAPPAHRAGGEVPESESRPGPGPFEFYLPAVVGMARSCGWLSMYVGLDWIYGRAAGLARDAAARLAGIAGVELLTPSDRMATIVSFRITGWSAPAALAELGARAFVIASAVPSVDAIRIGVGFFNTAEEIEQLAEAVEILAVHGPEGLPPRRRLTVIGGGP